MSDWFDEGSAGNPADVMAIFDSNAPKLMWEIAEQGALVSMGLTSDKGALGVTVTSDGRYRREYVREASQLVEFLSQALDAVSAVGRKSSSTNSHRSRPRRA